MTGHERFESIQAKFDRAQQQGTELVALVRDYFATKPYRQGQRLNSDNRPEYFVESVAKISPQIPVVMGDVLHNLKCCLDYMAFQLVSLNLGHAPTSADNLYFPISRSENVYQNRKYSGDPFFRDASPAAIAAVDALRPYKGGNDALWKLNVLNNVDKHRILLTAGGIGEAVDVGMAHTMATHLDDTQFSAEQRAQMKDSVARLFEKTPLILNLADQMFPLEPGDVFMIGSPGEPFNPTVSLRVRLGLSESSVLPNEPIDDLVMTLGTAVSSVIRSLRPLLDSAETVR